VYGELYAVRLDEELKPDHALTSFKLPLCMQVYKEHERETWQPYSWSEREILVWMTNPALASESFNTIDDLHQTCKQLQTVFQDQR